MTFPNMSAVFSGWTDQVQFKLVYSKPVDFEPDDQVLQVITFDGVLQPLSAREIDRKPEGERRWKWWTLWTTQNLEVDSVIQDPSGLQFRMASKTDWRNGGYIEYEMVEQPNGL